MAEKMKISVGADVSELQQGMEQGKQSIEVFEKQVDDLNATIQEQINNSKTLRQEQRTAMTTVSKLTNEYMKLSDEEKRSAVGQEMAIQLHEAEEQAAKLIDASGDLSNRLRIMASDTRNLDIMKDTFEAVGSAATSILSGIAAVTGEQEDLNRAIAVFGTVQSTVNTVTKVANILNKDLRVMIGIETLQYRALTKAKQLDTAATVKATIAQRIFNAVAKMNPYVILATAAVAATAAILGVSAAMDDNSKESGLLDKQLEKINEKVKQQREAFVNSGATYYSTAARISHLQAAYKNATDEISKTGILKEAQSEFKKLGIECNGVADAQRILVNQGDKVIEYLRLQGDVAAITALRMEAFKKSFNMLLESGYDVEGASILAGYNGTVQALDKRLDTLQSRASKLKSDLKINEKGSSGSKPSKEDKPKPKDNSIAALEQEYNKFKEDVKNGFIVKPTGDFKTFEEQFADYEKRIKEKKIELGFEQPDPKDIPGTEAWYKEQIKKLEDKKAKLPIDAVIEREDIQSQIDALQGQLNLNVGITIQGDGKLKDALKGDFDKSISGYSDAISSIESKLKDVDWSSLDEEGTKMFQHYIDVLLHYKEELATLEDDYNNKLKTPAEKMQETIDNIESSVNNLGSAFSALSQITGDETINTAGIVAEAIANLSLSFAKAMKNHKSFTVWDWVAAGTAGLAQLLSMIAAVKSAQGYANGGVIGGHSYYGDKLIARVNSGETILTKDQTKNAVNAIDSNYDTSIQSINVQVSGRISGKDLLLVQKNTNTLLGSAGQSILL